MGRPNKIRCGSILISGFFLLGDRLLKWLAVNDWIQSKLIFKYFGWRPFHNKGMALGLPLPNLFIIIFTLILIALMGYMMAKEYGRPWKFFCWMLVMTGALSNLFDRLFYGGVIDYFVLLTSVINLADILIIGGLLIYIWLHDARYKPPSDYFSKI